MRSASMMAVFVVLFCYFGRVYDASLISTKRISELFCSQLLSVLMGDAFMFVVLWLMSGSFPNLLPTVAALVVQLLMSLLWCKYGISTTFGDSGRRLFTTFAAALRT